MADHVIGNVFKPPEHDFKLDREFCKYYFEGAILVHKNFVWLSKVSIFSAE